MVDYLPRLVDARLQRLLGAVPAIAIEGPRGVGKTTTAARHAATVLRLDDDRDRLLLAADRRILLESPRPVLVDEWQRMPQTWDMVRRAVDDGAPPGAFILTGSVDPVAGLIHPGAGRMVTVDLRPLTLSERGVAAAAVSLEVLLSGSRPDIIGRTDRTLRDELHEACRSGFPGIWYQDDTARRELLDGYLRAILDHDLELAGRSVRNPAALRRWLTAYAAATATTASYESIRDAASGGERDAPARSTVIPLRDALERLGVLDPLPGWLPTRNHLRRLTESPKHHLADVALALRLLGIDDVALTTPGVGLIADPTLAGRVFESFAVGSIRSMATVLSARCYHLRTRGGEREVDLVVERPDGRILAFEIKAAESIHDRDVRHLRWLAEALGGDLLDAVVVTTGSVAYRRADDIAVVPLSLLGP